MKLQSVKERSGLSLITKPKRVKARLWYLYKQNHDPEFRDRLFEIYRLHARKISHSQFHKRPAYGLERSDFEQYGYLGLISAIEGYDPFKQTVFEAYSAKYIKGAIIDGLSKSSDQAAEFATRSRRETERLRSLRSKAQDDVKSVEQLQDLTYSLSIGLILEERFSDAELVVDTSPGPYESVLWTDIKRQVFSAFLLLDERTRHILQLHYRDGLSLSNIARLKKLSLGRISQIHKKAIHDISRKIVK